MKQDKAQDMIITLEYFEVRTNNQRFQGLNLKRNVFGNEYSKYLHFHRNKYYSREIDITEI